MSVSTRLRILRSKKKLSQQEVADHLEIDRNTYIKWENGTADIKSQHIPKIAEVFNVEIADLFKEDQKLSITNNFDNKDNSSGQKDLQQGIIINLSDTEVAKKLSIQLETIISSLKK